MRKKSYKNLFISLVIILAFFADTSLALAAKTAEKEEAAVEKEEALKRVRTEIKYTGFESKRNPFAPPKEVASMLSKPDKIDGFEKIESVNMPAIDLQGIIWSKSMPQVIINGSVMKAGDYIAEFQIKEVIQRGIILFHKGKEYLIKMQDYEKNQKKTKRIRKR